jgi:REP element-mobilizing transposase RayT
MAGTYTQLYIHIVFSVKGRQALLSPDWRKELFSYISGIISAKGHKSIIVNGVADHVHILLGMKPSIALSDIVRDIKNNSSKFINEKKWLKYKFQWQSGYGAFSYSHDQIPRVYQYILNQEEHHKSQSFKKEYESLLQDFNIDYNQKYIMDT